MIARQLLRWQRQHDFARTRIMAAQHGPHGYVIASDETGHSASYNDHTLPRTHTRFVADSLKTPFAGLAEAQHACEVDLRLMLARRQ